MIDRVERSFSTPISTKSLTPSAPCAVASRRTETTRTSPASVGARRSKRSRLPGGHSLPGDTSECPTLQRTENLSKKRLPVLQTELTEALDESARLGAVVRERLGTLA